MSHALKILKSILAPAGGGIHLVSTGLKETRALQRSIYGAANNNDIQRCWTSALESITSSKVAILGVPSDTGAGFVRGSNLAPSELRRVLLTREDHPIHSKYVVDIGDVRVIPHFLSDAMLSDSQITSARQSLYGNPDSTLPVAPLDMCQLALTSIRTLQPDIVPIVIGGDHSVGWPAFADAFAWTKKKNRHIGLLHFDAHTDLLSERLGVRYCFATWAYHANELLERDGRLVQVGIRASGKNRDHWERTLGVRQYWPEEYQSKKTSTMANEIIERFEKRGVDALYVSNDIDGTDSAFASATGTPESQGLHPDQVSELTQRIAEKFPLVGADLVEVAPPLCTAEGEPEMTMATASRYLGDLVRLAYRGQQ